MEYYLFLTVALFLKNGGGNIGAEITVVPFSIYSPYEIGFDFSSNTAYIKEASFGLDLNEYIYDNFMYGYFISLDKIIYKKKRQMASVEAGLKLNRLVAFPYEEQFGIGFQKEISSYYEVFSTYFDNYFQRNFISYFVKVNWIKVAPSKQILVDGKLVKEKKGGNTFSLFSIINYCPQKIGKGYYKFSYFEFENSGQVELGINYFGIGISYGFAF